MICFSKTGSIVILLEKQLLPSYNWYIFSCVIVWKPMFTSIHITKDTGKMANPQEILHFRRLKPDLRYSICITKLFVEILHRNQGLTCRQISIQLAGVRVSFCAQLSKVTAHSLIVLHNAATLNGYFFFLVTQ